MATPTTPASPTSTADEANATNPFEMAEEEEDADDASVHSAASQQLRQDFIRLTTQSVTDENDDYQNDAAAGVNNNNNNGYFALSRNISPSLLAHSQSLATASTTPRWLLLAIPVLSIVAHALFVIGQTAPMWRLSLVAEDISIWANATTWASQNAFRALNLDEHYHYTMERNTTVQTFTYGFAVQELWEAKGMPGVFLPRLAAFFLVLFSGFWPHLKLVMLQYCWWSTGYENSSGIGNGGPQRRTRTLGWLALLGKWSLADVLTVCVMVGVLNLEWDIDPPTIKNGIADHLETLLLLAQQVWTVDDVCNKAMGIDCNSGGEKLKCWACKTFVKEAYYEPALVEKTGKAIVKDIATNGEGTVRLSVVGMDGIYFFCAAVVLSVLLSVIVEWYNHKHVETLQKQQQQRSRRHHHAREDSHALSLTSTIETDEGEGAAAAVHNHDNSFEESGAEPLLDAGARDALGQGATTEMEFEPMEMGDSASVVSNFIQRTANSRTYQCFQCHLIVPIVTMVFVAMAIYLPSMERHVGGAIPKLLHDILGLRLDKVYSLQTLRDTCGAAGGLDLLLMATFGLFIVLGPLIRAILVVAVAMTKSTGESTQRLRSFMVAAANFLAAFCAWEVFLCAIIMVELLMPSITNTILNTPACHIISGDDSSCLQVQYERIHTAFACLVLGFLFISGLAIHVDLEDSKERFLLENNPVATARLGPLAATDLDGDGQYYVEVSNGTDEEDGDNNNAPDANGVTTMMQQETV